MFDTTKIRHANNLMAIISDDAPPLKRVAGTGGGEWAGPCPFCGGTDRFRVQPNAPDGGRWLCRTCTDGRWQDVIAYVMRRDNADFPLACERLGGGALQPMTRPVKPEPVEPTPKTTPSQDWQQRAQQVVFECERWLWSDHGERANNWLHLRGLHDETLRRWHIGLNPHTPDGRRQVAGLTVPCGIVIPGYFDSQLWYLKVRRPAGEPKYVQVAGSKPALYLSETLACHDTAVLTEGEFDALLLWQEAGDQVGVATPGSAMARVDSALWGKPLQALAHILVAYDADQAGQDGTKRIVAALPRARAVTVPTLASGHKDITDYHVAGGSLKDWVTFLLRRHGIHHDS